MNNISIKQIILILIFMGSACFFSSAQVLFSFDKSSPKTIAEAVEDNEGNVIVIPDIQTTKEHEFVQDKGHLMLIKYTPDGNFIWAKKIGAPGTFFKVNNIHYDYEDNIYVNGHLKYSYPVYQASVSESETDFGNTTLQKHNIPVVLKFNSKGEFAWGASIKVEDNGDIGNWESIVDSRGNVFLVGFYKGKFQYAKRGAQISYKTGERDVYLVKFNPDGNQEWAFALGESGINNAGIIALDGGKYIDLWGEFSHGNNFSNSNEFQSGKNSELFIASYDTDGVFDWGISINKEDEAEIIYNSPEVTDFSGSQQRTISSLFTTAQTDLSKPVIIEPDGFETNTVANQDESGNISWSLAEKVKETFSKLPWKNNNDIQTNVLVAGEFSLNFNTAYPQENIQQVLKNEFDEIGNKVKQLFSADNGRQKINGLCLDKRYVTKFFQEEPVKCDPAFSSTSLNIEQINNELQDQYYTGNNQWESLQPQLKTIYHNYLPVLIYQDYPNPLEHEFRDFEHTKEYKPHEDIRPMVIKQTIISFPDNNF